MHLGRVARCGNRGRGTEGEFVYPVGGSSAQSVSVDCVLTVTRLQERAGCADNTRANAVLQQCQVRGKRGITRDTSQKHKHPPGCRREIRAVREGHS